MKFKFNFEFDYENNKTVYWLCGFLIFAIITIFMMIFGALEALAVVGGIYFVVFGSFMVSLHISEKNKIIEAQKDASTVYFLDSKTTVKEDSFDEMLFRVLKTSNFGDLSRDEKEIVESDEFTDNIAHLIDEKLKKVSIISPEKRSAVLDEINNYVINVFDLDSYDRLPNYETQPFHRMLILAPQKELGSYFVQTDRQVPNKGRYVPGTKIYGDHVFIMWLLPDRPLFLLYNSPKIILPLASIRKDLIGIGDKIDLAYRNEILDLSEYKKNFDHLLRETQIDINLLEQTTLNAKGREEWVETKHLEDMPKELNPDYDYFNKSYFYLSVTLNFLFGSLLLAIYLYLKGVGIW